MKQQRLIVPLIAVLPVFEWRILANLSHESPGENWAENDSLICVKWRHAGGSAGFLCQAPDHDSLVFLLCSLCFTDMPNITEDRRPKVNCHIQTSARRRSLRYTHASNEVPN